MVENKTLHKDAEVTEYLSAYSNIPGLRIFLVRRNVFNI